MGDIWHQGSLDGLCGLYSTINAVFSLIDLTEDDCTELFRIGLEHLDVIDPLPHNHYGGYISNHQKRHHPIGVPKEAGHEKSILVRP